jgi:transposase
VVESLDISAVTDRMEETDPRGTRPYHPRMMLALSMYAYCCGIYSSRRIAAATYDMIPFRVLTGDQHPHFTVINEFRLRHLDAFVDLFVQLLMLCGRAGLLARTSHQLSAAAGDAPHPAVLSHLRVLDVLSSTPPRPSNRNPHCAQRLAGLATKPGEKYGLGACRG